MGAGTPGPGREACLLRFLALELHAVPTTPSTTPAFQNRQAMQEVSFIFDFQASFHKSVLFRGVSKYTLEHSGNRDTVVRLRIPRKRLHPQRGTVLVQDPQKRGAGALRGQAGSEGSTLGHEQGFATIRSCLIRTLLQALVLEGS